MNLNFEKTLEIHKIHQESILVDHLQNREKVLARSNYHKLKTEYIQRKQKMEHSNNLTASVSFNFFLMFTMK